MTPPRLALHSRASTSTIAITSTTSTACPAFPAVAAAAAGVRTHLRTPPPPPPLPRGVGAAAVTRCCAAARDAGSPPPAASSSSSSSSTATSPFPSAPSAVVASEDSGAVPAAVPVPQLPLCRRPAVHVDELGAALVWKSAMADRISHLGDSLEREDGGPDMAGLLRELDWVLDDVIEAVRLRPDAPWEETSWRELEPRARAEAHRRADPRVTSAWQLRLREPLPRLWEWWERRLRDRVPFQYLISSAHWHRYVLSVGPGVLVPRPETEIFPEIVRTAIFERPYLAAAPWADLGTGSGAIAISAADELRRMNPAAEVWAVDLSPVAVGYARFNAQLCLPPPDNNTNRQTPSQAPPQPPSSVPRLGAAAAAASSSSSSSITTSSPAEDGAAAGGLVRVVQGSWFEPLQHLRGQLGGVLSNPPYIPRREMAGLQAEVGRHEPLAALDGGEGPGLDSLQALCCEAAAMLAPGGLIALETAGGEQAGLVADMLRGANVTDTDSSTGPSDGGAATAAAAVTRGSVAAAFEEVEVLPDCYGVRRFVRAYRRRH